MRSLVAVLASVAVLGAAWYWLAPTQIGGSTSYAVTFGTSMEPHFHHGDLVVLRRRPTYAVGDVVAYHSHDLHKNVLHRIIAIRDGHYTFKGDNNDFVDPERPTARDLVGVEWHHLPAAGNWLAALHSPRYAAVAAFLIVLLLVLSGGGTVTYRQRRRKRPTLKPKPEAALRPVRRESSGALPSGGFVVAAAGAGALVAAALLGAVAFTRPLERSLVWANLYVQHGRFSYSAPVEPGATYQGPRLRPGDPVYLQLVHRLPVAFAYRLQSTAAGPIAGSASLDAVLRDDEGWVHRIVLAPKHRFTGTATTIRGTLDLRRVEGLIRTFEEQTGVHNTDYHVTLAPHVAVHGTVAARPLATTFAPTLALDLDAYRLAVAVPTQPDAAPNSLSQSVGGSGTRIEASSLHALGRTVTVAHARRLATLLGIAGLVLAGVGGLLMLLGRREHEVAAIRRRYEDWIVDVMPDPQRAADERRVPSMDALARLAARYERLILHERRNDADAFLVEDDGVVYAYVVHDWSRPPALLPS
jgi:signal peptidase I